MKPKVSPIGGNPLLGSPATAATAPTVATGATAPTAATVPTGATTATAPTAATGATARDHRAPARPRNKTLTWSAEDQGVLNELRARLAATGQGVPTERDVIVAALRHELERLDEGTR